MDHNDRCDGCTYYASWGVKGVVPVGFCKRHAPSPALVDIEKGSDGNSEYHTDRITVWPLVRSDEGCGEFQAKAPTQ